MGRRKERYAKPKPKLPKWTERRRSNLICMNMYRKMLGLYGREQYRGKRVSSYYLRTETIPSSLIRKAMNAKENFMDHYETHYCYSPGIACEEALITMFAAIIAPGFQVISKDTPFLSATPDGFCKESNIPIEIKTSENKDCGNMMRFHYHQFQFIMYCTNSRYMYVILYQMKVDFKFFRMERDQNFICECLRIIEYSYFRCVFNANERVNLHDLDSWCRQNAVLKYCDTLLEKPTKKRIKKEIRFNDETEIFLKMITVEDIDAAKYKKKLKSTNSYLKGEFQLCFKNKRHLHTKQ